MTNWQRITQLLYKDVKQVDKKNNKAPSRKSRKDRNKYSTEK